MLFDLIKIFTCGPEFFIANFAIKREPLNVNFDMSPGSLSSIDARSDHNHLPCHRCDRREGQKERVW